MTKSAVVVFAKEPKDGKVKTRLAKDLAARLVTQLYEAFIKDVLSEAIKADCDQRFIYYSGHGADIPFLRKSSHKFHLRRQTGKTLGERMHRAFKYCYNQNYCKTVIIGTDCLTLTTKDINKALKKLDEFDCVLGPCKDGGFYLIAMKSPSREIFDGIKWSAPSVLSCTLANAAQLNYKTFLLPVREDIDELAHLRRFSNSSRPPSQARHTRQALEKVSLFK